MYIDQSVSYFLDKLASNSPEPGGGSTSALAGALSAALVSMVSNLTIGNKKYVGVEEKAKAVLAQSEKIRKEMQDLVVKDTIVYGKLSAAYKLPKNTSEESIIRIEKINIALKEAIQVPLNVMTNTLAVLKLAQQIAEFGNVSAVSDAGVAALLGRASAESAALNIKINLKGIKDIEYSKKIWNDVVDLLNEIKAYEKTVLEITYQKIG
jgi:formiminotetrahydrofolate cyclodeaminase